MTMTFELRGERDLVLKKTFDAPIDLLWKAYTDCKHLKHWWGPNGWDLTFCKLDLKVGGQWHYCMAGEYEGEKMESWGLATYEQIDAPTQLIYSEIFADSEGNMLPDTPEMSVTVEFKEVESGTEMIGVTRFESSEARQQTLDMGVEQGIRETWERLVGYLPEMT